MGLFPATRHYGIAVHDLLSDYARERHSLGKPGAVFPATGLPELAHAGGW